ncbi:unnamed protein product [Paramecium sonneborni]|uniref:Uncharacterized protein n=1 Tax=Paramecium sonneborni TaxID=65129 RepID=A0A8S1RG29_9CILI|nr:unnamed protein product [Paramecium sonneborni]
MDIVQLKTIMYLRRLNFWVVESKQKFQSKQYQIYQMNCQVNQEMQFQIVQKQMLQMEQENSRLYNKLTGEIKSYD